MIFILEWAARVVLGLLIILSVYSLKVIFERYFYFKNYDEDSEKKIFLDQLESYLPKFDNCDRFTENYLFEQEKKLTQGLSVLSTLGATAPFIGLLGTVLGIIVAFGELSSENMDMNAVMFLLAEALILTAVGLIVAIPAVIAFNIFQKKADQKLDQLNAEKNLKLAQHK